MFHRRMDGVVVFVRDRCLDEFETVRDFMDAWSMAKKQGWQPDVVGTSQVFGSVLCSKCKTARP